MEVEFSILDLAQQNRVFYTRDVSLLNSFENVLTNEIVWVLVLFWKKILREISLGGFVGSVLDFRICFERCRLS